MLLTENQVRRVIRKTIVQNNYRVNERFYRQLNKNLMYETFMQDLARDFGNHGLKGAAMLALASFGLNASNPTVDIPAAKQPTEIVQLASKLDAMTRDGYLKDLLRKIQDGTITDKEAQGLVIDAAKMGIAVEDMEQGAKYILSQVDQTSSELQGSVDDGFEMMDQLVDKAYEQIDDLEGNPHGTASADYDINQVDLD